MKLCILITLIKGFDRLLAYRVRQIEWAKPDIFLDVQRTAWLQHNVLMKTRQLMNARYLTKTENTIKTIE